MVDVEFNSVQTTELFSRMFQDFHTLLLIHYSKANLQGDNSIIVIVAESNGSSQASVLLCLSGSIL